jgi:hypothetical protein
VLICFYETFRMTVMFVQRFTLAAGSGVPNSAADANNNFSRKSANTLVRQAEQLMDNFQRPDEAYRIVRQVSKIFILLWACQQVGSYRRLGILNGPF